eukprot:1152265-Pelagomonas_calceolata.AAC.1
MVYMLRRMNDLTTKNESLRQEGARVPLYSMLVVGVRMLRGETAIAIIGRPSQKLFGSVL